MGNSITPRIDHRSVPLVSRAERSFVLAIANTMVPSTSYIQATTQRAPGKWPSPQVDVSLASTLLNFSIKCQLKHDPTRTSPRTEGQLQSDDLPSERNGGRDTSGYAKASLQCAAGVIGGMTLNIATYPYPIGSIVIGLGVGAPVKQAIDSGDMARLGQKVPSLSECRARIRQAASVLCRGSQSPRHDHEERDTEMQTLFSRDAVTDDAT